VTKQVSGHNLTGQHRQEPVQSGTGLTGALVNIYITLLKNYILIHSDIPMAQFSVIIEMDEDGYIAHVPALQGCYAQGDTYEEVFENIQDVIKRV